MDDKDVDIDNNLEVSNINDDINTARIDTSNGNGSSLFATNNLYKKTADNLAQAEAMVNEVSLRNDKTIELKKRKEITVIKKQ